MKKDTEIFTPYRMMMFVFGFLIFWGVVKMLFEDTNIGTKITYGVSVGTLIATIVVIEWYREKGRQYDKAQKQKNKDPLGIMDDD